MSKKYDLKFWLVLVAEIIVAFALFIAVSEWQARDMLTKDSQPAQLMSPTLSGEYVQFPQATSPYNNTLLYFFAPWCTICDLSIGNLNTIKSRYPEDLQILIVALDYQSVAEVEEFINDHDLPFPVVLGNSQWARTYQIQAFPSYYITDATGRVLSRSMGYSSTLGMLARLASNQ
jgi:thiol-disulfide isomerase/thioredoxin